MTTAISPLDFTLDRKTHVYRLGGRIIPGLTSIMKSNGFISEWAMDEGARRRGSFVHAFTQFYDEDDLDWSQVDDDYLGFVMAWERFRKGTGFTPTLIETPLYHPIFLFAATLDRDGLFPDGSKWICEIKTGHIPPYAAFQTAAQELLVGEKRQRMAVELHADGTYRTETFKDGRDANMFLSCLAVHNWKISHGIKQKERQDAH
jgi:hypothetical protein